MPKASRSRALPKKPKLLGQFEKWLERQEHPAVGYLELDSDAPGDGHFEGEQLAKLRACAIGFARTPDGSEIIVVERGALPHAVVVLGSEGEIETVATSPEQFLHLLARGETGNSDLDDEAATSREELARWLTKQKVSEISGPPFDLAAFLEGSAAEAAAEARGEARTGPGYDALGPRARQIAELVGRRADDPAVVSFFTGELKKRVPASLSDVKGYEYVEAPKRGLQLLLENRVLHPRYPEIKKSARSFVPYVATAYLEEKFGEPWPFGATFEADRKRLEAALGAPSGVRNARGEPRPIWQRTIDSDRGIVFDVDLDSDEVRVSIRIDAARDLSAHGLPPRAVVGLFVAWAIQRGLFDAASLPEHAGLVDDVLARKKQGSALVDRALERGLWDRHLVDRPGLRDFAFGWFHNVGKDGYIRNHLVEVFGAVEGEHGHDRVAIDDDPWEHVDRATPKLDSVFAEWLS